MERVAAVEQIMDAFAERTGLTSAAPPRRYLWTDAFAVCNYLALHRRTGARHWLERARQLIDQVHHVLGRHRADDARAGWISGLAEAEGALHPTIGGLRIGKLLPERRASEPPDERLDWERDGQYYHYLTRWLHALERAAAATGDAQLLRYGVELARAAHAAFTHGAGGDQRLYWKMSIDLSVPVVASMGQHDALDGLAVTAVLHARSLEPASADARAGEGLHDEVRALERMCGGRGWASADALGIGGLLVDALQLTRLAHRHPSSQTLLPPVLQTSQTLLPRVLHDAARSLDLLTTGGYRLGPAHERLPFRELGLAIGLAAVERLEDMRSAEGLPGGSGAVAALDRLLRHVPLRSRLEAFWSEPPHQRVESWTEHEDINAVMLATCLLPEGYLD